MAFTIYDASVPVFTRMLASLSHVLTKGASFAEARKIDPAVLLATRLYPDMFPLSRQVQLATDHAKGASARLSQTENPKMPDTEATFAELAGRIEKTLAFIGGIDRKAFDGADGREVTLMQGGKERVHPGPAYLTGIALPNFFFHVTTAYDILRHVGVEIGKRDFVGG
ncbi:MAG: DUF1993 domain-containing protein [Rhizobiales bacterium]|nr:DUF1993 domain-containing protein [Hyphomicrobiales bacterium]